MTDLGVLKAMFEKQAENCDTLNWEKLTPRIQHLETMITMSLGSLNMSFVFNKEEELIGTLNWQE
ncbi:hypothetical protein LCGC14_2813140 [marine sediment metagenome]|uniref:Uncharacterized protein n=1 Tax=marine sediment metagenome TaxID=412755 RepID=A0A0F9BAM7_9ZZZZ